jgi:Tfp pilus assembly protein PilO
VTAALKLDLSPRLFATVLIAVAAVVAAAGWYVEVAPKHNKAATLEAAIQSDQTRLTTAAHGHGASSVGKQNLKAEQAALDAALPSDVAMPNIVDQLNALATQAGVLLDTVTPGTAVTDSGYVTVPLTVVVDGHYFAVEKFLRLVRAQVTSQKSKLAASGRLFDVTGMQLEQTEPAPMLTATFQVNSYYYSPGATAPTATTTADTTTTS